MRSQVTVLGLALWASLATSGLASTYVVDGSGSGQFTDIPAAIAAAHSGDVLVVLPGSYSAFTLDKGLTIVGYGAVAVGGVAHVTGIVTGQRAVLVGFSASELWIDACAGPVIAQELVGLQTARVAQANDVRLRLVNAHAPALTGASGMQVSASRVELCNSNLMGGTSPDCSFSGGGSAGDGLDIANASRVQIARSNCIGGVGTDCFTEYFYCGGGGNGIYSRDSTILLTGGTASQIQAGVGGVNGYYSGCDYDGGSGIGISVSYGDLWYSGATIMGQASHYGSGCTYVPPIDISSNVPVHPVTPDDPTLDLSGTPVAGANVQFVVRAPLGSVATLNFGRAPVVIADGLANVEQLAAHARVVHLGSVPASGQVSLSWNIPAILPAGAFLVAQADLVLPSGELRRTNSLPIVVR